MAFSLELSYVVDDDGNLEVRGTVHRGQVFTTVGGFTLSKVSIKLWRFSGGSGDITLSVYNVAGGLPSGAAIATEVFDSTDIPETSTPGDWFEIELSSPIALSATTSYAIAIAHPSVSSGDGTNWRVDTTGAYAGGTYVQSANGGSSWATIAAYDFMFRLYSGSSSNPVQLTGTTGMTFTTSACLGGEINIAGSTGMTFSESAFLTFGMLSGTRAELFKRRLVAAGNDQFWFEDL